MASSADGMFVSGERIAVSSWPHKTPPFHEFVMCLAEPSSSDVDPAIVARGDGTAHSQTIASIFILVDIRGYEL